MTGGANDGRGDGRAPHNAGPAPGSFRDTGAVDYSSVDIAEKLSLFSEQWAPKVVARLNDYEVKVVKLEGEFVWHTHEDSDEFFLVTSGKLTIQMRDGNVTLGPGQIFVVPSGVEHCPLAEGEAHVVLIEPAGVVNTGDAGGHFTATPSDL
jgi:mannose-6-phosphate isomerase-like protein (cupin superfamily)